MDETHAWLAKAAISEMITRYAALNDAGDWESVAAMYSDDGRMNRPTAPDDFVVGRHAILASFRSRPPRAARHIVANTLVTLEGDDAARATSQILLFTGALADDGPAVLAAGVPLIGTYHDRLALTGAGWRFVERKGSLDFRVPK